METLKICFRGPLKNHNFSLLEELGITNSTLYDGGSDSYYYIDEDLELCGSRCLPEGYVLYNENQFFNEWTNYLKEVSAPLDKTKIYCQGCFELKQVLEQIRDSGVQVNGLEYGDIDIAHFAYSVRDHGEIGFVLYKSNFYPDHGYKEVTPQEFKEAWLGSYKDIDFCCRGGKVFEKIVEKLKNLNCLSSIYSGDSPDLYYFIKPFDIKDLCISGNINGKIELSPKQFFERVLKLNGIIEPSNKKEIDQNSKICCRGSEYLKDLFNYLEEHKNIKVFPYIGEDPDKYYWIDKCSVVHANEKVPKEYKLVDCNSFGIYWEEHLHDKESITRPSNDEQAISCKTNPEVQIKLSIKQPLNVII